MREPQWTTAMEDHDDEVVAFAAFALNHAGCGDAVLELRLGERCILGWCPSCAAMRVFVSPAGRGTGAARA